MAKLNVKLNTNLTRLIEMLSDGHTQADVARELKVSKSAISQRIKKLIDSGLISERPESKTNLKFYHVKQALIHHDKEQRETKKQPNYDLHAIEVSLILKDKGNLPEGDVDMKNWSYWSAKFGNFSLKVHYGKDSKLIIYPPHSYGDSKPEVLVRLGFMVSDIVALVERMFKCEVDRETYKVIRRPEVHPPKDALGKAFEENKLNDRGVNIEINQSKDRHMDIIGMDSFEKYDKLITDFPRMFDHLGSITASNTRIWNLLTIQTESLRRIAEYFERKTKRRGHIITRRRGDI